MYETILKGHNSIAVHKSLYFSHCLPKSMPPIPVFQKRCDTVQLKQDKDSPMSNNLHRIHNRSLFICDIPVYEHFLTFSANATTNFTHL